jgi:hypothetical protein
MYAVVRKYSGVPALIKALEQQPDVIRDVIGTTPGFISYYAMRDGEALATVTICQDRESADETSRRAAHWVSENVTAQRVRPPEVVGGDVFIHVP